MLELRNVSFVVDDNGTEKKVVDNVSFVVPENKFVAITGPNGGGKSTIAKLIAGIEHVTSGEIYYKGTNITDMNITERARLGISFAFQQPVRFKGITVKDMIALASGKDLSSNSACEYLAEVGLCARDYINREINASLSGGELKRIEIAMTIARKTPLTIFDEPEAGIDLWSFQNLITVFKKLREEVNGSIVIISHQERILDIADEIIVIANGKLENTGNKDSILPGLLSKSEGCRYYKQ